MLPGINTSHTKDQGLRMRSNQGLRMRSHQGLRMRSHQGLRMRSNWSDGCSKLKGSIIDLNLHYWHDKPGKQRPIWGSQGFSTLDNEYIVLTGMCLTLRDVYLLRIKSSEGLGPAKETYRARAHHSSSSFCLWNPHHLLPPHCSSQSTVHQRLQRLHCHREREKEREREIERWGGKRKYRRAERERKDFTNQMIITMLLTVLYHRY